MLTLELESRDLQKSNKHLRKEGYVPGVLYGEGLDSEPVMLSSKALKELTSHKSEILKVHFGQKAKAKSQLATVDTIQLEPVQRVPIHFSLLRTKEGHKTHLKVPVHIKGEAPGAKTGGIINQYINEIELVGMPQDLPSHIDLSIAKLKKGDFLRVSDLDLPKNITVHQHDLDKVIISCQEARVEVESSTETPAPAADAATEDQES